jgi:hypothetical protein
MGIAIVAALLLFPSLLPPPPLFARPPACLPACLSLYTLKRLPLLLLLLLLLLYFKYQSFAAAAAVALFFSRRWTFWCCEIITHFFSFLAIYIKF